MDEDTAEDLEREVAKLRKAILRQGHRLDLFREQTGEGLRRVEARLGGPAGRPEPSSAQVRALMELGRAVDNLYQLSSRAVGGASDPDDQESPRSLREGLDLLQIRIANLQRSFDLRPIRAVGQAFDDRLHEVRGSRYDPRQARDVVLEELLPGYTLAGRVVRPAQVVVNRPT